jgi:hypothetical protein
MKSDLDKITKIEDVDEAYNKFEEVMVNTIDEHAPMKKRKSISQPALFMNKTLRSAVYIKRMTHDKFLKDKSNKNWEAYRKQRNLVTKLKKQSIRTYFYERCFKTPVCLKALFSRIYITLYLHRN